MRQRSWEFLMLYSSNYRFVKTTYETTQNSIGQVNVAPLLMFIDHGNVFGGHLANCIAPTSVPV